MHMEKHVTETADMLRHYVKISDNSKDSEVLKEHEKLYSELSHRFSHLLKEEKRVIFLGPPGCGKGTQGQVLKKLYGFNHLSTGDMLRDVVSSGTEFGKKIQNIMARGCLVDDETVVELVRNVLMSSEHCRRRFILDGFPRTFEQAKMLHCLTQELHCPIDLVIYFKVPDDILVERICERRIHLASGRIYHTKFNPPKLEGKDDVTGEPLTHRADDNKETFEKRLSVYHKEVEEVLKFYKKQGIFYEIIAIDTPDFVTKTLSFMLQCTHEVKS